MLKYTENIRVLAQSREAVNLFSLVEGED